MDSSDWLDIDENNGTDLRQHQLRLAQNELNAVKLKEFNQGYVEGTEWANQHYQELNISAIPSLKHNF